MATSLASEINMLAHRLKRIAARSRKHRDFTLNGIAVALRETIAALPVYRTYITESSLTPEINITSIRYSGGEEEKSKS